MNQITVHKLNYAGQETWSYSGKVLHTETNSILIEARFNRPDLPFHGIVFGQGDRFLETYYSDRWYNIYEIHDRQDDHLKGWYCNVSKPAVISEKEIRFVDLALDLLVYPGGAQLVLDEDEFAALPLIPVERDQSLRALAELKRLFASRD
ncbi:MAG: DUF402 domain-containing protein [Chloroflexi bacterium]|nr:DUF402 domain-containing protein [Chloroflexota bacterium]